jgi:hypothetical protein
MKTAQHSSRGACRGTASPLVAVIAVIPFAFAPSTAPPARPLHIRATSCATVGYKMMRSDHYLGGGEARDGADRGR